MSKKNFRNKKITIDEEFLASLAELFEDDENEDFTNTENGALTLKSSGSKCLDFFATVGALRRADDEDIIQRFQAAWQENADLALKTLFYARDVRGGLGERRVFQVCWKLLGDLAPEVVAKNILQVAEYGRFDDLLALFNTKSEALALLTLRSYLKKDLAALAEGKPVSLLAKWLPSVNTSSVVARHLANKIILAWGWKPAKYRKVLSTLRRELKIIENNLREVDYTFDYSKQPSKAMFKYRDAFHRHDQERYQAFLESVNRGESKLHTDTLYPYDIIAPIIEKGRDIAFKEALEVTWNSQEDYTRGENALVVVDGSGSMYWSGRKPLPASVAQSLAIYFAERNHGAFKDYFITFSEHPRLVKIEGSNIVDKVLHCMSYDECANTNIQRVFELVLEAALKNKISQSEMPQKLYIISDMEFDSCANGAQVTNFEYAKKIYADAGYTLPQLVFWNVDSRNNQQPVRQNEQGVVLVSGASPRIFQMVTDDKLDPYQFMLQVLQSERYAVIAA